ncbi:ABC transporter permease [Streptomyces sp. NPDC002669]|uniref:ABC transporter permease n=1 Tax=Streptomyces sp. NPDC002669 TaxID=3364658 RepID=UPI0036CF92FC
MLKAALRNVLAHKAHLVMTVLAVCLGVGFVSGTLVFGDTSTAAHRAAASENLADLSVRVSPKPPEPGEPAPGGRTPALDDATVAELAGISGVDSVRPSISGSAVLNTAAGDPMRSAKRGGNRADAWIPGPDGKDPRFPIAQGHPPRTDDEIALDAGTAARGKHKIGDEITLATNGPVMHKRLVGTVTTRDTRVSSGTGTLVLFDKATAHDMFGQPGAYSYIDLTAKPGTSDFDLAERVTDTLGADRAETSTASDLVAQQDRYISVLVRSNEKVALIYALVALFIGSFLIVNTFTMLVARRSREIALLRAIGASRRQVIRSLLIEAGLVGLFSSALGLGLGLGLAVAMPHLMTIDGSAPPTGPLVIGATPIAAALFVGVGLTVLSAWIPSRKASKIAPVEALRAVHQPPSAAASRYRAVAGGLLTFGGAALLISLSGAEDASDENLQNAVFGTFGLITGLLMLAPILAAPMIRAGGKLTTRFGAVGRLSRENALRDPRRTAATASAVIVSTALVVGLATIAHSSARALDRQAAAGLTADHLITADQMTGIDQATARRIADTPGVRTASAIADGQILLGGDNLSVTGVDPAGLDNVMKLDFVSGSLKGLKAGAVAVSETTAREHRLRTGSRARTTPGFGRDDIRSYTVIGVYRDNPTAGPAIGARAEIQHLDEHGETGQYFTRVLVAADKNGVSKADLLDATGRNPLLTVQSRDEFVAEASGAMGVVINLMYGLLFLGGAVSALGIANTLAMSITDRTREIGTLRVIGMHRAGIRTMIRLEALTVAAFGTVLGVLSGTFGAWTVSSLANGSIKQYEFTFPWGTLLTTCALSLAVGILAAALPARRAAGLSPLEAVAES